MCARESARRPSECLPGEPAPSGIGFSMQTCSQREGERERDLVPVDCHSLQFTLPTLPVRPVIVVVVARLSKIARCRASTRARSRQVEIGQKVWQASAPTSDAPFFLSVTPVRHSTACCSGCTFLPRVVARSTVPSPHCHSPYLSFSLPLSLNERSCFVQPGFIGE